MLEGSGGSRVVQVISRNHSNVSKPAFVISRVLYCSSRNQLSFLFYWLLWNKTKKKSVASRYSVDHTANPALPERIRRVSVRAYSSFVDTSKNNAKKFVGTTRQSLYPVGGTGWCIDFATNYSKPISIGQKHSHCLANYSKSVVISYSGRKLPWKLLTIASLEVPSFNSVLVEFRLEFIVNLPRRKTRFWFINHGSRRSSLSEGGLFSVRYWPLSLLLTEIS